MMKRKVYALLLFALLLLLSGSYAGNASLSALPQQAGDVPAQIRVQIGRSLVINSQETLERVSVTDPAIASAIIVAPTQVLIHGITPGTVTLILWDDQQRTRSFNLTVEL